MNEELVDDKPVVVEGNGSGDLVQAAETAVPPTPAEEIIPPGNGDDERIVLDQYPRRQSRPRLRGLTGHPGHPLLGLHL